MKALTPPARHPAVVVLDQQATAAAAMRKLNAEFAEQPLTGEKVLLVSVLAAGFPAVWSYANPTQPDTPYIHVFTSVGQLSWPVSEGDMLLFAHVPYRQGANWIRRTQDDHVAMLYELAKRLSDDSSMVDAMEAVR